jgi:hypothetical protein
MLKTKIINGEKSLVYDPSSQPINLIDPNKIYNHIYDVFRYLHKPQNEMYKKLNNIRQCSQDNGLIKQMKKEYEINMSKVFPEFSRNHPNTFEKVIYLENIEPLLFMLSNISKIKAGKINVSDAEQLVSEMLKSKFVKKK